MHWGPLRNLVIGGLLTGIPMLSFSQCPPNTVADTNNLVVNGDFEQGNTAFTSQYTYCNTFNCLQPESMYAVGPDASFFHTAFVGFDHTTGSGNFMVVNGSSQPNTNVWCQTITVNPNTVYQFSAWVQSCVTNSPAILQFRINGTLVGNTFTALSTLNFWDQFYTTWNSGAATTATICIVNQNTATGGNDFGLDDIVFTECIPCQIGAVSAFSDTTVCAGQPVPLTATADTPASFLWSPPQWLNDPTLANPTATTGTTTTFTVTGTDSVGCSLEDSVTVTITNGPPYSLQDQDTICLGDTAIMPLNGSPQLQYQWTPAQGLSCVTCPRPTIAINQSKWYYVQVTGQGCTAFDSIYVKVVDTPVVDAGPDKIICNLPFTQLSGSYTSTVPMRSILWTPPAGLSHTYLLNPIANPANTTTYTLTITNIYGCARSDSVRVIRTVVNADAGPDTTLCKGESVQIGRPADPGTTYRWLPAGSLSNDTIAQPVASPTSTTTYTLSITDSNGCQATDQVTVTVSQPPLIQTIADTTVCPGASVTLSTNGGIRYQWTPANGLSCDTCASPQVTPNGPQQYVVQGWNAQGCTGYDTITVNSHAAPHALINGAGVICAGDTIQLTASGLSVYQWTPISSVSCDTCPQTQTAPLGTTTYTVTGADANGCRDTATATVTTQQGPPLQIANDTTICPGGTAQLSVQGGTTYQWSPANSLSCNTCPQPAATPAVTTTYTVIGFSTIGCNAIDTVRVTIGGTNNVTISGDTLLCPGDTATWIVQGTSALQWSPATGMACDTCTTTKIFPANSQSYTLTGVDNNGCVIAPRTRSITITPPPVLTLTYPDTLCLGQTATIQASGAQQYQWQSTTGISCTSCANPTVNPSQTTIYYLSASNAAGCTTDTSLTIVVIPAPAPDIQGDSAGCAGDTLVLRASPPGQVVWQGQGWIDCTTCDTIQFLPAGSGSLVLSQATTFGCSTTDTQAIIVHPTPVITLPSDTSLCLGDSSVLTVQGASQYTWQPGTGLSCTSCASPVVQAPSQPITYTVIGINALGCTGVDSVTISSVQLPGLAVPEDTTICRGDSLLWTAGGATQYQWSPNQYINTTTGAQVSLWPVDTLTYTLVATDASGCRQDTTITVAVHQPLPVWAGPDTAICPGSIVQLTAVNGQQYQWAPPMPLDDPTSANPMATPTASTLFTVRKTDSVGCMLTDTVSITVFPSPTAEAGQSQTIPENTSLQVFGSGGVFYQWAPPQFFSDPNAASPIVTLSDSTWLVLQVEDANGCTDVDSVFIAVLVNPRILIPNGFSPNSDGKNDVFAISANVVFQRFQLQIFNRWGQMVFTTNDAGSGWNGRIENQPAPTGTYVWQMEAQLPDGRFIHRQGNVTLLH